MNENMILGPSIRTANVAGNWNVTLATVYIKIEMDFGSQQVISEVGINELTYLFPTPKPRS